MLCDEVLTVQPQLDGVIEAIRNLEALIPEFVGDSEKYAYLLRSVRSVNSLLEAASELGVADVSRSGADGDEAPEQDRGASK